MQRKLILLAASFVLLLLALGTYQFFMPGAGGLSTGKVRTKVDFAQTDQMGKSGTRLIQVKYDDRNSKGELRSLFRAEQWKKLDDGSFEVTAPRAEIRHSDGKRTYLVADKGRVWLEEAGKGFDLSRGRMEGNVMIFYDQSTALQRKHPLDRTEAERIADDVARIHVTDIDFFRNLLKIETSSRVSIWSNTMDLVGKGLTIDWSEQPR
ncbi:MAG: hypothetical protein HN370_10695, partial [Phycisphaerales bacterium]|nr:hypothetical protein [Phycisphaerales bacterium]